MTASCDLIQARANLQRAQNELEAVLFDLGIDPYHFEVRMDEVVQIVTVWCDELDDGFDPQECSQEFMFDRT